MKVPPTEVREHFLDEWAKIKIPKVLVEKLEEYEDVHGKTKRPTVPFINKEKSYCKTIPLNTRGSLSQLEDRDCGNIFSMSGRKLKFQRYLSKNWKNMRMFTVKPNGQLCLLLISRNLTVKPFL
ncbi:hypothetical protein TNCV_1137711 [Trichonephila clavipes]|nr:hypothetical protein TNCV_1137711 [Trichonephila clavipes]